MYGGLLKSASRLAILASAIAVGGVSANAADLGGNCCADLEERVAELEATTARKGNRKVKLTVSGHVNEMIMFWDDGAESNAYIGTNQNSRTRFRFVGDARINADWSAGYLLEIGVQSPSSFAWNQTNDDQGGRTLDIRHSAWYLDSKTFGRVWVGHTSSAADGITEINLSNAQVAGSNDVSLLNYAFALRRSGAAGPAGLSSLTWAGLGNTGDFAGGNAVNPGEGGRYNVIKYVSPTFAGFSFQTAWGEDDMWDVALRYAGEFSGFRLAAGVGYQQWSDNDYGCANVNGVKGVSCEAIGASASVMHVPTGLYVAGSYGQVNDDNRDIAFGANVKDRDSHYYIQGGIEQNWFGIGATTLYGEYFRGDYGAGLVGGAVRSVALGDALNPTTGARRVSDSELTVWGLGLVQGIDAAAMHLYMGYRNYSADVSLSATGVSAGSVKSRSIDDFQSFIMGGIIRF